MNRIALSVILLGCSLAPTVAQVPFKGMRTRIPNDANTLILINAEKMFGSPVADREGWAARRKAAYDAGVTALSPNAIEIAIAGRSDHEFGESIWELGLVRLRGEQNVTTVAARYGGEMDEVLGRSAARLPADHYVVQLASDFMASYTPANRQDVSRWLRSTDIVGPEGLPPYLEQAFGYATKVGSPIVMAMDIGGAISEAEVKRRMGTLESLKDSGLDPNEFAKLISSAKGITLGITVQNQTIGAIRVDFDQSPQMLAKVGKPLLIEILRRQGAMLEDINDWTPAISGNTFLLKGGLNSTGVRKVMSVLELPASLTHAVQDSQSPGSDPEGTAKLLATQQYYKSVTTMLEDLRMKPKRDHVKTFGQAAMWYDKYARKIDRLPILNVDEELLNYGTGIATMLRDAEAAMKGVGMRTSQRTAANNPSSGGYSFNTGGGYRSNWGYGWPQFGPQAPTAGVNAMNASLQAKGRSDAVIRGQERTRGAATVQDIWQGIDESTAAIRRTMTSKYSATF